APVKRRRRNSDRSINGAALTTFVFNAPTSGYWFATPLFMQTIWGWSVLESGLALVPTPVVVFAAANLAGRLSDRGMIKRMVTTGIVLVIVSSFGMYFALGATPNYWTGYFWWSILYGLALGLSWSTMTAAALIGVESQKYGAANGSVVTFRTIGSAMGVALVIAVSSTGGERGSVASFHRVYLVLAFAFVIALILWLFAYPRDERRT
ncbi:MAG: MFS transporter, partial [Ilumatobacteraceae bacterium]